MMDEKLELILRQRMPASELDATEVRRIKEERLSTEKCLQICAQLSEHISQIQITMQRGVSAGASGGSSSTPEKITNEGLQECQEGLARVAQELGRHEKQLFDRLMSKLDTTSASQESAADIFRLREELESTRKSMDILSKAGNHLEKNVSVIENHATGDALQIMVSANGKTLHGTNRGLGWRTRQIGGYLDNETVRQISRDMSGILIRNVEDIRPSSRGETPTMSDDNERHSQFMERYGEGFILTSKTKSDISTSPAS